MRVTRRSTFSVLTAFALIGLAVGLGLTRTPEPAGRPAGATSSVAIEDLLFELQIVPMDGQTPSPFTLPSLDGTPVSLADLRGRPVLLYFWASW